MGDSQAIASHGYVVGYGAFGASDSRAFVWLGRPRRRLESDWCHVRDPGEIAGYNDDSSGLSGGANVWMVGRQLAVPAGGAGGREWTGRRQRILDTPQRVVSR